MTPAEIRARREELRLTRQDLARRAQLKYGRVAAIELEHGPQMTEAEHEALERALGEGKAATPVAIKPGVVRVLDLQEWCGLSRGDPCRVRGIAGARFTFLRYVEQENGHRYAELVGGRGRGTKVVRNVRCIAPERILDMKGRLVWQVWTAANPDEVPVVEAPITVDVREEDEDDDLSCSVLG